MKRAWDIQFCPSYWLQLGFHIDHEDPSLTLHFPFGILTLGYVKQPGFREGDDDVERLVVEHPAYEGEERVIYDRGPGCGGGVSYVGTKKRQVWHDLCET